MSHRTRALLLGAAALLPASLPASTAAQQVAQSTSALEEIVVTARRREENMQSVPLAVQAFTAETLRQQTITQGTELVDKIPSLLGRQYRRETVGVGGFAIRGVPGVRVYFAETTSTLTGAGDFYDLQNVQVLKGPQGTLFGLQATGGAILVEPKRPTNTLEGYVSGIYGNYNRKHIEGALNVPIVDGKVLLRLAGSRVERDGYTTLLSTGQKLDNEDAWNWRAALTLKPFDNFENYFLFRGGYSHFTTTSKIILGVNPVGPLPRFYPIAALNAYVADQAAIGPRQMRGINVDPLSVYDSRSIIDIARYDINDDLSVKAIGLYQMPRKSFLHEDDDGTSFSVSEITQVPTQLTESYTGELQVLGSAFDKKLDFQAGYYLAFSQVTDDTRNIVAVNQRINLGSPNGFQISLPAARTHAIFGQVTLDLAALSPALEGLKLTAGGRYNWDYRSAEQFSRSATGICTNAQADSNCRRNLNGKWKSPGYTFSLDYQVVPGTMVYATTRKSYSSGGFNASSAASNFTTFKPEFVTDYELGVKSDWELGGVRGRTNGAVYYDLYDNIQRTSGQNFVDASGRLTFIAGTTNAAKEKLAGFELEATIIPVPGLEFSGGYNYNAAWYTDYPQLLANGTIFNRSQEVVTGTVRHKYTINGRYTLPLDPSVGDVTLGVSYVFQGKFFVETDNTPFNKTPAYGLWNLRADWRGIAGWPIDAGFYVNNLTNKLYTVGALSGSWAGIGLYSAAFGEPRFYGAQLTYHFNGG